MEENSVNSIRLNKAISDTGFCSRRGADKIIEEGRVVLNGKVGVLGDRVTMADEIVIDGKVLELRALLKEILRETSSISSNTKNEFSQLVD